MTCLIDANILSEATRPSPAPQVMQWLGDHEGEFVVDSIVLDELDAGILTVPRSRERAQLEE